MQNHTPSPEREFLFTDQDFRFLAELASHQTGIQLPDQKRDMVYGRLVRRLRVLGLTAFSEYCELLRSDAGEKEMDHLINAITTNLTSFFREGHHFEHLKSEVLPKLQDRRLRIWSAGCSSGMEPYSIAMTIRDAIPKIDTWDARILATDIDSNMLDIGRKGQYAATDSKNIPAAYKKYIQVGEHLVMKDELKKLISFLSLNLLNDWPMKGKFDAIFCRNVVIYFDKPTKQRLFERMADLLKPNGWLYIGHSENLQGVNRFELIGRTIYRKL